MTAVIVMLIAEIERFILPTMYSVSAVECVMPIYKYSKYCGKGYSVWNQDEQDYKAGWVPLNASGESFNSIL